MLLRQNEMHVMKCAQGLTSEPGNCITTPCERHTKVTPLNFSEKNRRDALILHLRKVRPGVELVSLPVAHPLLL